ncbi:MAG: V-type ATP synthase subunit D [Planctomycetes bacterium]|nr:V-type ATP synthase subunit D [Planctomycetota bacterium]
MAKIKFTKNELKAQRDALKRFLRYLPTLELKKRQLMQEIRKIEHQFEDVQRRETEAMAAVRGWVRLLSEEVGLGDVVRLTGVETREGNIAGVTIPIFVEARFATRPYDLFAMPLWVDWAVELIVRVARLRAEREVLATQHALLREELRITTQRVNLFEKVKIPESRENIRQIQIFLGDQQTNAVVRGKIAKTKLLEAETA